MAKKEISILYYIQKDGIRSSMYLNVKQKRFIFGSAEHCGIRIYKNGIFPEHCALTTGKKGNVFIEPLHPSSLTLINNTKLVHRIYLNDNDIITICGERFFFTYLSDNLFNKQIVKISFPISCTEQAQLSKKLKIIHSGKKNHGLFMETEILNEFYVLKKMLDLIGNDIIKNSEYKLLEHHGLINIPNQNIIKRNYFHSNVSLIKYANQCIVKSMDPKTRFTMKFYELFYYLRRMLNSNSNYKCILLQMIQCLSNYCINKDIYSIHLEKNLGMSLKYIYLQHFIEEKIINHKQIQHTESLFKLPITLVSSQPKLENINQNMTVKTNTSYNHNCFSDVNSDKKKQKNHQSNRKISSTYKKRVSLAVKQYHLRKRKSVLKAKCAKLIDVENSAPLVLHSHSKVTAERISGVWCRFDFSFCIIENSFLGKLDQCLSLFWVKLLGICLLCLLLMIVLTIDTYDKVFRGDPLTTFVQKVVFHF
ncbi:FHA domain-containing protein [Caerostris extrusa]|uniref:FHA domain-containing protein n=1 Tax=Caerostris extrusa TaxID=172846 RepID=A0AAV4XHV6_CAEEX|nr:FHA domain-containing protein [Caerostris extrusa]